MADRVIEVLTPADSYDLVTLDELKVTAGIHPTDTTQDAQLTQYISTFSDVVSELCNRVFAYEQVSEIWRCTNVDNWAAMKRLFVSRWPIDPSASLVLESPTGTPLDVSGYIIEVKSGKIELLSTWTEPITVTYWGGYRLPDECPPALKQATGLLIREAQAMALRMATGGSGVRSLSHKDKRVQFFDPLASLNKAQAAGGAGFAGPAISSLLSHYIRHEV